MEGLRVAFAVVPGPLSDGLGRAGHSEPDRSVFC